MLPRHLFFLPLAALLVTLLSVGESRAADERPAFAGGSNDLIQPGFSWGVQTYAARCRGAALTIRVKGKSGWLSRVGAGQSRSGSYRTRVERGPGQAVKVRFGRRTGGKSKTFRIRCLPEDFANYSFERKRPGGPDLFVAALKGYATIFDRNGVPIWWFKGSPAVDAKILDDGTLSWSSGAFSLGREFQIRNLSGKLLRTIGAGGDADTHGIQLLPNGNYIYGYVKNFPEGSDTSEFGGASYAYTQSTVLREVTPQGKTVWSWFPSEHLDLSETGRWWGIILEYDNWLYDVSHWNAVEVVGRHMYLSFRNRDAIYKVNRETGRVVWKLGGTETSKSLRVLDYPDDDYVLGAQHDVRVQPNGSVTVFNNRSFLENPTPRAERFRINEEAGTARLVEQIEDSEVKESECCGSARRLPSKDWLVSWGETGIIGAYDPAGRTIFRLRSSKFSYRANPVAAGMVTVSKLRRAMNRMNR